MEDEAACPELALWARLAWEQQARAAAVANAAPSQPLPPPLQPPSDGGHHQLADPLCLTLQPGHIDSSSRVPLAKRTHNDAQASDEFWHAKRMRA